LTIQKKQWSFSINFLGVMKRKMSQSLVLKSSVKITKQQKAKKLQSLKKQFEKVFVYTLQENNSSVIASINARYNHSNGKSAIPLVNKIGESCFNFNQLQVIKKEKAEYDTKLGYWFISL